MIAVVLLTAGCGVADPDRQVPPASSAAPARAAAAQAALDDLVAAARTGDRARFDAGTSRRDPSFGDRARLLFDNLSTLPMALVRLQLQPGQQPLSGARLALLGTTAWRQPAVLTWQLDGEAASAEHTVWLTFVVEGPRTQLAGTLDGPAEEVRPQPIWWTGPVTAATDGETTVLVGAGQPVERWRERASTAVAQVRRRATTAAVPSWRRTVVEVPASRRDFEAVVGAADGSYAAIAAVTLAEGPSATAAVRVVVNRHRPSLGWSERDIAGMVEGFARTTGLHFLPDDRVAVDRALVAGRTLAESGDSALLRGLSTLATGLVPESAPAASTRRVRRRTAGRGRRW